MSPKSTATLASVPTSDVTPESALKAIERTINEAGGMWAKGARVNACKIAGQRLANALAELDGLRAKLAEMENGMAPLIQEALAAVSGTTVPSKTKVETVGTSDKPTPTTTK